MGGSLTKQISDARVQYFHCSHTINPPQSVELCVHEKQLNKARTKTSPSRDNLSSGQPAIEIVWAPLTDQHIPLVSAAVSD